MYPIQFKEAILSAGIYDGFGFRTASNLFRGVNRGLWITSGIFLIGSVRLWFASS